MWLEKSSLRPIRCGAKKVVEKAEVVMVVGLVVGREEEETVAAMAEMMAVEETVGETVAGKGVAVLEAEGMEEVRAKVAEKVHEGEGEKAL